MLLINGIKYATSDSEMVDSLFNDGSGTLEKFHKIKHNKNESLFYITEDSGVAICKGRDNGGMLIKFTMMIDSYGKKSPFFQYRINKPEEEDSAFKWFIEEQQNKLEKKELKTMQKLNEREESIKRGYLDCLNGKRTALALRDNGRWTATKSPKKCSLIWFTTDDGLSYKASPAYIEEKFLMKDKGVEKC